MIALDGQARDYAAERGIIIADTKFEFGLDPASNELVLVDEVLTPDSSRFWPAESYQVGRSQQSYDKVCGSFYHSNITWIEPAANVCFLVL